MLHIYWHYFTDGCLCVCVFNGIPVQCNIISTHNSVREDWTQRYEHPIHHSLCHKSIVIFNILHRVSYCHLLMALLESRTSKIKVTGSSNSSISLRHSTYQLSSVYTSGVKRGKNLEIRATRPRLSLGLSGRGQSQGQSQTKLWIKSIKWWLTAYRRINVIMIKTTRFNFSFSLAQ